MLRFKKGNYILENASAPFPKFVKKKEMPDALKYIVDNNGHKTTVLVPAKVWENLNNNYQKLQNKMDILNGIKEGLKEVREAKRTGRKLQTLKDFLK